MTRIKWWTDEWYPVLQIEEADPDTQPEWTIEATYKPSPKTGRRAIWRRAECNIVKIPDEMFSRYMAALKAYFEARNEIWDELDAQFGEFVQIKKADLEKQIRQQSEE